MDCDALSVIVTTQGMCNFQKETVKDFLMLFGSIMTLGCSLPSSTTGSSKPNGIFGCNGNECQHLSPPMQGNEMLVIDMPVKIALHCSCKQKLIHSLRSKGYFLEASKNPGICFDPHVSANKPPYPIVVDSIIESCLVSSTDTHIIHVADMGFRLPIKNNQECPLRSFFTSMKHMATNGLIVEVTQLDIAFVCPIPKNNLIQVSCTKAGDCDSRKSLIAGSKMKVYPLHQLSKLHEKQGDTLKMKELKGTVLISKHDTHWTEGHDVTIGVVDRDNELDPYVTNEAVESYRNNEPEGDSLTTNSANIYSIKLYSTIAHSLLQRRNRFPMRLKAMYGTGNRTISALLTMLQNLDKARENAFQIVKDFGIGMRIEVSIRPPPNDPLRTKGHLNDFLLHVCLSLDELCNQQMFKIHLDVRDARTIDTCAMKLLSDTLSQLKFQRKKQFNEIYSDPKATQWLRAQLSHLMITIGICPAFGVKYVNTWLYDDKRHDPHNYMRTKKKPNENKEQLNAMLSTLKKQLRMYKTEKKDSQELLAYVETYPTRSPISCHHNLSLQCKLHLPMMIWQHLIPEISKGAQLTNEDIHGRSVFDEEEEDFEGDRWWPHEKDIDPGVMNEQLSSAPTPTDPKCLVLHSLSRLSTLSHPESTGFLSRLCEYIIEIHDDPDLISPYGHAGERVMEKVQQLLEHGKDADSLPTTDLKFVWIHLTRRTIGGNLSKMEMIQQLCQKFHFPCHNVQHSQTPSDQKKKNRIINSIMRRDIALVVLSWANKTRYYRVNECCKVDIWKPAHVALIGEPIEFTCKYVHPSLYSTLGEMFNCKERFLRGAIHREMTKLGKKLKHSFILSEGNTNPLFSDVDSLKQLESDNRFQISLPIEISDFEQSTKYLPHIILPMMALMYNKNIIYFDFQENVTSLLTPLNNRWSVKYHFRGTSIFPRIPAHTLSLSLDGTFQWNQIKKATPIQATIVPNNLFTCDPIGGHTHTSTSTKQFHPHLIASKDKSFHKKVWKLLQNLDEQLVDNRTRNPQDPMDIITFVEELSSSITRINCFSEDIISNAPILSLPISSILFAIRETPLDEHDHHTICPLICLKYKLLFGVLELDRNNKKFTHFYAYNPWLRQVQYRKYSDYTKLVDRRETIYLYVSESRRGYFKPISNKIECWKFNYNLSAKYSHLGVNAYEKLISALTEKLNVYAVSDGDMKPAQFRPEDMTVVIPTLVKCTEMGYDYRQNLQAGINHHAIILIFPFDSHSNKWQTCIIHHPHQNRENALDVLEKVTRRAPSPGDYSHHCIGGIKPAECECAFLMSMYAVLGHRSRNVKQVENAIMKLCSEPDLMSKVRGWVAKLIKGSTHPGVVPLWIESATDHTDLTWAV